MSEANFLDEYSNGKWSESKTITVKEGQYEFVKVSCCKNGLPMVLWVEVEDNEWVLKGSLYEGEGFGKPHRISSKGEKVSNTSIAAAENGIYVAAWENCAGGVFKIMLSIYNKGWSDVIEITDGRFNSYEPSVAVDVFNGFAWIAYSSVDDMFQRSIFMKRLDFKNMQLSNKIQIARGGVLKNRPNFNTNPSVICDYSGNVWVAYENDSYHEEPWSCIQGHKNCSVVCYDGSNKKLYSDVISGGNNQRPFLCMDGSGRIVLLSRKYVESKNRRRISNNPVKYEGLNRHCWDIYASLFNSKNGWSEERRLAGNSKILGRLHKVAASSINENTLLLAWQADNKWEDQYMLYDPAKPMWSTIFTAELKTDAGMNSSKGDNIFIGDFPVRQNKIDGPSYLTGRERIQRRVITGHDGEKYILLYGNLHEHSNLSRCVNDGSDGELEENYRYGMDVFGYDFMAVTDHDIDLYHTSLYEKSLRIADLYNNPPYFITIPAIEFSFLDWHTWGSEARRGLGSQCIYFSSKEDALKILRSKGGTICVNDKETSDIYKLIDYFKRNKIKNVVIPPHQLSDYYSMTDWSFDEEEYRTVLEIFQVRGSYEYHGCPRETKTYYRFENKNNPKLNGHELTWAQSALALGRKVGFIASSDHRSTGVGTAAVMVKEVSREGIIEALKQRRCYATTGDKIFVDFRINGHMNGQEIKIDGNPHITAEIVGTDSILEIVIFKNNKIIYKKDNNDIGGCKAWNIDLTDENFYYDSFYYLRVIQHNNEMAWSSPIWVNKA